MAGRDRGRLNRPTITNVVDKTNSTPALRARRTEAAENSPGPGPSVEPFAWREFEEDGMGETKS